MRTGLNRVARVEVEVGDRVIQVTRSGPEGGRDTDGGRWRA